MSKGLKDPAYEAGLQKALDLVNGNWDAWQKEVDWDRWIPVVPKDNIIELVTRIITDIQTA